MTSNPPPARIAGHQRLVAFFIHHRLKLGVALLLAFLAAVALYPITRNQFVEVLGETVFVALVLLMAYGAAGAWRQTWVPSWVAQVLAVAFAAPIAPLVVQLLSVNGDLGAFMSSRPRVIGFWWVTIGGGLVGLLVTLGALLRERDAQARAEALEFALERERLERQATDARLSLLQAQIEPHFLLNTLANVQELIESGSPRAAPVFKSLIAYLRAAMPQLNQRAATLGDEMGLVRSYLELMLMRMPDRLQFSVELEPAMRGLAFPAMALLTLVENAVKHGVDPSCEGGEISVRSSRTSAEDGRCMAKVSVADTGVGMSETAAPGTGLSNLQARLQVFFGAHASLELSENAPHGLRAEICWKIPV